MRAELGFVGVLTRQTSAKSMPVSRRFHDCFAAVRFCAGQGARNGYHTARFIPLEHANFGECAVKLVRQDVVIGAVGWQVRRRVFGLQITPPLKRPFECGLC